MTQKSNHFFHLHPNSIRWSLAIFYWRSAYDSTLVTIPKNDAVPFLADWNNDRKKDLLVRWADYTLQQSSDLAATNWPASSDTIADDGTNRFIIAKPPSGSRFYRLTKP
jgi:hypothetical protein